MHFLFLLKIFLEMSEWTNPIYAQKQNQWHCGYNLKLSAKQWMLNTVYLFELFRHVQDVHTKYSLYCEYERLEVVKYCYPCGCNPSLCICTLYNISNNYIFMLAFLTRNRAIYPLYLVVVPLFVFKHVLFVSAVHSYGFCTGKSKITLDQVVWHFIMTRSSLVSHPCIAKCQGRQICCRMATAYSELTLTLDML